MRFIDVMKRLLPHASHATATDEARRRIRAAWGLEDESPADSPIDERPAPSENRGASDYDRSQWTKRLRRVLDELPASQAQWHELVTDAHALELEPEWIGDRYREEFEFLVRRAVADRVVSEEEHHKLELARRLIGMPEEEAERALHSIIAEAENFFGTRVKDEA